VSRKWNVWVPRDVSAMTKSCVVIPFRFMYLAILWHPQHLVLWPAIPTCGALPSGGLQDIVHESYKGRTKLIGDLHQRNCTLLISNIDQPNIDIPEEIVADENLDVL
ncbi:unnamed protein product, partial [Coregonus sp. 'balchen']